MGGIVKMVSGIGAAVGAYRAVVLCMVLVTAWSLHAGWVQTLCTGDTPGRWVARAGVMWTVLFVAFLPTTRDIDDKACMGACILVITGLLCLSAHGIVALVTLAP